MKYIYFIISIFLATSCVTNNYIQMYADEDIVLYSKPNEGSNEVIVIPAGSSIYVNSSIEKNDYREFRYGRYKGWTRSSKYVYGKKGWTKKLYGTASVSNSTIDSTYRRSYYTPSSTYTPSRGTVQVKGYYRKDGTYVRPHTRSAPRRR